MSKKQEEQEHFELSINKELDGEVIVTFKSNMEMSTLAPALIGLLIADDELTTIFKSALAIADEYKVDFPEKVKEHKKQHLEKVKECKN